ncbi:MAG: alpha/beta hydrolase [Cyanobacteria bacterium J06626_23]
MTTADVYGAAHHYELTPAPASSAGAPAAIVFVHGWLLSHCYWQPLIAELSSEFTCLSYDLRGFGNSAPGRADYRLAAYAEDLLALIAPLGLNRVWLVGHSLGGSIALWAAHLAPEMVQGVLCLNAGGGVYVRKAFEQFRGAGEQMIRYRHPLMATLPLLPRAFSHLMVHHPLGPEWGRRRLIDFVRADAAAARGALLESTTQAEVHQLPQIVSGLTQPAYFVAGAEDTIMEPRYVRHLASFHPLFTVGNLIELSGCGHFAMLEQTAPVAQTLRRVIHHHAAEDAALPQAPEVWPQAASVYGQSA